VPDVRGVAGLEAMAGVPFDSITAAREQTARGLIERRKRLDKLNIDPDATVVLMGSWGRGEVTSESDDDFMVLFEGPRRERPSPTIDAVAELLGGSAPGAEEIFGNHVWLEDLRGKSDAMRTPTPISHVGCCSCSSQSRHAATRLTSVRSCVC
jgi:predicted nucleotidyltransferase